MSIPKVDRPPVPVPAPLARRRRTVDAAGNRTRLVFALPALVLFTAVVIAPVCINFFYSLTDWNGFAPDFEFVGFENFVALVGDPDVRSALLNTVLFTLMNAPLQVGIGLLLALALHGNGRLRGGVRLVLVLPIALSGVVVGLLGTVIFDPRTGILAGLEGVPVLSGLARDWLGDPSTALGTVVAMNVWAGAGFSMLIFLAGLAGVPTELYEAARLDGAGAWESFRHVTWPLIAPALTINVVLVAISGLKVFDLPYILTKGGPAGATETVVMLATLQSGFGNAGYSAAVNFALTILLIVVSVVLLKYLRRREVAA